MDPLPLLRTSTALLAAAALVGAVMAVLRFARDRPAPLLLSKLHAAAACAGMTLLVYGWATVGLTRLAAIGLVLLLLAVVGGLVMTQAWRWKDAPAIELLLFGHLSLAATGFILLFAAAMGPPA
jgi:hypothetical protein